MRTRISLVVVGVLMAGWGGWKLLQGVDVHGLVRLPLWLGGAVVADDLFLVPLSVGAGWLVARWSRRPDAHRTVGVVRTTLLYVGITSLIAVPLLLRQGTGANPTVLPRNYLRDWLLLEATIVVIGAVGYFTFSRARASSGDIGGR
ncbi:hypothetical protein JOF29_005891 [Kribbella aluminosa]|uniref:Uncharacterized protein n=1 Tax=Kribbella aluminosa TaxID=416017 RepID=A0ABS4UT40_9ACTN|nr:hypothetical protein [Kribbella aluminosa]MBP2354781.1 hypothetical protein [Kribbella aluminosa]